jgi:alpha-methylacyl-CoA racemase
MRPLDGVRILDFSTLLPGPLAGLILAEAGAEVIKIERPEGEDMRRYVPRLGPDSLNFAMLNRGKRSLAIDLKAPGAVERLHPLIREADVVLEQFRPGVMDRLGLGYEALRAINPRIIYCAITGYGPSGPKSDVAAHDLNYCAEAGMLSLAADREGRPVVPAGLVADIAGGAYPAVINILLALRRRDRGGEGCRIDVSMSDNLFAFMYWAIGSGTVAGRWPRPGRELLTGGSPRYNIYPTKDRRFVAAAPLEERFWRNFCELIDLPGARRDDDADPAASIEAVAAIIAGRTAEEWRAAFAGHDVCCCIVATLEEALADPQFRRLFERRVTAGGEAAPALVVPVADEFRGAARDETYPRLGEANASLLGE